MRTPSAENDEEGSSWRRNICALRNTIRRLNFPRSTFTSNLELSAFNPAKYPPATCYLLQPPSKWFTIPRFFDVSSTFLKRCTLRTPRSVRHQNVTMCVTTFGPTSPPCILGQVREFIGDDSASYLRPCQPRLAPTFGGQFHWRYQVPGWFDARSNRQKGEGRLQALSEVQPRK